MPGPLSTPKGWDDKERWNHSGDHGLRAKNPIRQSGKSDYDRRSGKWARHLKNAADRAEKNRGGKKRAEA